MKASLALLCTLALVALTPSRIHAESAGVPKETPVGSNPLGIAFSVKMTGPYAQDTDLQIICAFKHKASGDTYQGAMKDSDAKLGGLISSLRNRGGFGGELGETILFTPPKDSIPARQFLIIGLGD